MSPKKTIRKQTGSAWNFLQPSIQVCRGTYIPYFKINAPIFCGFIFFFNTQVRIYKMLNEEPVDYHPSPLEFTSKIHPLIFLWTRKRFISPEYFLIFSSNLYIPPWLKKIFQIHGVKITEKYICESKNWICSFLHMPTSKTLSQVFIITTSGRRKLPISPKQSFWKSIFPQQRVIGPWSWKYDQN